MSNKLINAVNEIKETNKQLYRVTCEVQDKILGCYAQLDSYRDTLCDVVERKNEMLGAWEMPLLKELPEFANPITQAIIDAINGRERSDTPHPIATPELVAEPEPVVEDEGEETTVVVDTPSYGSSDKTSDTLYELNSSITFRTDMSEEDQQAIMSLPSSGKKYMAKYAGTALLPYSLMGNTSDPGLAYVSAVIRGLSDEIKRKFENGTLKTKDVTDFLKKVAGSGLILLGYNPATVKRDSGFGSPTYKIIINTIFAGSSFPGKSRPPRNAPRATSGVTKPVKKSRKQLKSAEKIAEDKAKRLERSNEYSQEQLALIKDFDTSRTSDYMKKRFSPTYMDAQLAKMQSEVTPIHKTQQHKLERHTIQLRLNNGIGREEAWKLVRNGPKGGKMSRVGFDAAMDATFLWSDR